MELLKSVHADVSIGFPAVLGSLHRGKPSSCHPFTKPYTDTSRRLPQADENLAAKSIV